MNLRVFSERDPEKRREAIERTYVEDVRFIDPDGESVGREALNDRAQKILDDAPADFVLEEAGLAYVSPDTAVQPWRFGPPGRSRGRGIDVLTVRDGSVSVVRALLDSEGMRDQARVGKSARIEFSSRSERRPTHVDLPAGVSEQVACYPSGPATSRLTVGRPEGATRALIEYRRLRAEFRTAIACPSGDGRGRERLGAKRLNP